MTTLMSEYAKYGAVFSHHPSEASFVGPGSLAEGSSVSVWFTPLSLCSIPA